MSDIIRKRFAMMESVKMELDELNGNDSENADGGLSRDQRHQSMSNDFEQVVFEDEEIESPEYEKHKSLKRWYSEDMLSPGKSLKRLKNADGKPVYFSDSRAPMIEVTVGADETIPPIQVKYDDVTHFNAEQIGAGAAWLQSGEIMIETNEPEDGEISQPQDQMDIEELMLSPTSNLDETIAVPSGNVEPGKKSKKRKKKKKATASATVNKITDGMATLQSNKSSSRVDYIPTNKQLNKIRLSRHQMERFLFLPFFKDLVKNCFVRLNIGRNNGKFMYRVAEIVDVIEMAKHYSLGKYQTNKGLLLRHGNQERVCRIEFVSNGDFSSNEHKKWDELLADMNITPPTLGLIERKRKEIKDAIAYEFTDASVQYVLDEKNRLRQNPINYARSKLDLIKKRDAAILSGDDEVVRDLTIQIKQLEEHATELDNKRSTGISAISYINQRNRNRQFEEAAAKVDNDCELPEDKQKEEEKAAAKLMDPYSLHDFEIELDIGLPSKWP